ncbi:MAG: serine hydrolase [Gordonibacter sp.]|uniref:serine hydrolase n=2 Tax=Gordonibacter sp. TaxID=1968902 RepID=UPI002FC6D27B
MAQGLTTAKRRIARWFRHLPGWSKVVAAATCSVAVLFGAVMALSTAAVRLEEPVFVLGAAVNATGAPSEGAASAPEDDRSARPETAPTALDAATGAAEVNLFEAAGSQRVLDAGEIPDVAAALAAFGDAGWETGFVVYDFKAERGLGYNADVSIFSASTVKAPYVAYVAQEFLDSGRAQLADEVFEDAVQEGTGIMAFDQVDTYDLGTVLSNTIVHSDNTGYALLRENYSEGFEAWAASAGVDAAAWQGEWYPFYTPRDLAKLWLSVGGYLKSGSANASLSEGLLSQTGTSFIRQTLGGGYRVLAKPGYEIDTPRFNMGALNDAGIVRGPSGDYLIAVMSDADYDDEYFTDNEPLIKNLIAALAAAHDRLLAA